MLRPAPSITFRISSLASLRKHLQQPVPPAMPPFRFGHKPPRAITAYSATVPLSAPPPRPPGRFAAEESAAAPSVAAVSVEEAREQQVALACGGAAGCAVTVGRATAVPCPSLLSPCLSPSSPASSLSGARTCGLLIRSFPQLAFQFGAGRQAGGDCLASLLVQVLGVKGKQQLETGFAAHLLPLLPGGRDTHGEWGEGGESRGREGGRGEEWREGLRGVEWEEYVQRVGEIVAQGGLAGEHSGGSSSSGMVVSGVDPTEFAFKCGTLFCQPMFARAAALIFSDCAAHRHKESVEDAAVEGAVNRLAAAERSTEGSGVQDRGKRAVDSEGPAVSPAVSAAGSTGARTKGSNTASGARLVPVNSNAVVALFTYRVTCLLQWVRFYGPRVNPAEDCRCFNQLGYATALPHPLHDLPNLLQRFGAVPKLPAATGQEGLARTGWEEFPEGDRAAVAEEENDPARKFSGCSTFHVGAFRGGGSELCQIYMT
ncbi:unnamed protein product [Closterium sp. Naga37s-1]|nr:unnamed protein product [Closterium sp. Naga37s-1]